MLHSVSLETEDDERINLTLGLAWILREIFDHTHDSLLFSSPSFHRSFQLKDSVGNKLHSNPSLKRGSEDKGSPSLIEASL